MEDRLYKYLQFGLVGVSSCLNVFWTTNLTLAQQSNIIPDNTLGAESSRLNRNVFINGINADRIDGGAIREGSTSKAGERNLFHSFSSFSINNGQAAYFANPSGVENILTRVTGGNPSNILGTLGVDGAANLFLINPNGIVFGENASLDLQGSFLGTTADSVVFENGMEFSAKNPETVPLLKISIAPGLQYGQNHPSRTIKSTGNLAVGKDLTLFAGNLDLQGNLIANGNITLEAKDMVKAQGSIIFTDWSIGNAGDINIIADSLEMTNGALLYTSSSGIGNAGNVTINVRDSVSFDGVNSNTLPSGIVTFVGLEAQGKAGDINISTGSLSLTNGAVIFNARKTGNVTINARENISIDGFGNNDSSSGIKISSDSQTQGKAGNIDINTGSLFLTNGGQISSFLSGNEEAGNVKITARENISFDGVGSNGISSGIQISSDSETQGKAGEIDITTGSLFATNGGLISSLLQGNRTAGNVTINARDTVSFDGVGDNGLFSGIMTISDSQTQERPGNIDITTGSLFLTNGAALSASALGIGNSGKITIEADNTVSLDGDSNIYNFVAQGTEGMKGGGIEISTGSLWVKNGASLQTSTLGNIDAGDVIINARNSIVFDDGNIDSGSFFRGIINSSEVTGNAGDIKITTGSLQLENNSDLSTLTVTSGNGGNIKINATDFVRVHGGSKLSSSTSGKGNAGNIEISAGNLVSFDGSGFVEEVDWSILGIEKSFPEGEISSGAFSGVLQDEDLGWIGSGKAGDIKITTGSLFVTNDAGLATHTSGKGDNADAGNIIIRAQDLVSFDGEGSSAVTASIGASILPSGEITISGVTGDAGDIDIQARSLSVTNGAYLFTATVGKGKGGNIRVNTTDSVIISNTEPVSHNSESDIEEPRRSQLLTGTGSSYFQRNMTGIGGNIDIKTGVLKLSDGGVLNARSESVAKAGNININADRLELTGSGKVLTTARHTGAAGNITVNAKEKIIISGFDSRFSIPESGFFANSETSETTNAGNIKINTPQLLLNNRGQISTETSFGNGGEITLELPELLLLRNGSQISTTAGTAEAGGDGGNIDINSKFIVAPANEDSNISANAFTGSGGKVNITSQGIFGIESRSQPTDKSDITASSQRGISGETNINAADTSSIQNSFTEISPNIDTDAIIANSCIVRGNKRQENTFLITGSGGLRSDRAGTFFVSKYATGEVRNVEATSQPWKKGDPIIEPQGLYRLSNGELLLSRECSG